MAAVTVRECWNAMNAWSRARVASEVQSFTKRQPIVSACVLAYLDDDGQDAVGVGLAVRSGLKPLGTVELAELAVERAERQVAGFACRFADQAASERARRPPSEVAQR